MPALTCFIRSSCWALSADKWIFSRTLSYGEDGREGGREGGGEGDKEYKQTRVGLFTSS